MRRLPSKGWWRNTLAPWIGESTPTRQLRRAEARVLRKKALSEFKTSRPKRMRRNLPVVAPNTPGGGVVI